MTNDTERLIAQLEALRARNRELEETLDAIRSGEVDAIVVSKEGAPRVYTLEGADHPYRVLVENIREGALTLSATGTILYANSAFAGMRRHPLSAIIGTSLRDHVLPRDRSRFDAMLEAGLKGPVRGELGICSGSISMPVLISLTPIVVDDAPKISVVVSDRKEDYDRLRLQGRMLDAVADAVIATDPDGRITYWNDAAVGTYGWTKAEAMGRLLSETVRRELTEEDRRRMTELIDGGHAWSGEYLACSREGRRFPVRANEAPVFDEDGLLVGVIGTSHDISERRGIEHALAQSEERLRLAQAIGEIGVWEWDPSSDRLLASPELERICAVSSDRVERMDDVDAFIHPDDRCRVAGERAEALDRRRPFSTEFRFVRPSGEVRWLATQAEGLYDENGILRRVIGVTLDVSEQKQDELRLAQYAEELRSSNDELERFAYVASHDLQEPLRSITSFSELLARRYRDRLDGDANEYLDFIVEGGQRMQALIRDLLAFSRVGTAGGEPVPTPSGEVLDAALQALEVPLREADGTVTVGSMPVVRADRSQLEQVFSNLVGNALKYRRPRESPRIAISSRRLEDMVEFAVTDNGIGIEAEYHDRIFEMFRRLHTHDQYEGTGIGLAIVKKIVERHGGTVRVESVPGEGSTFLFTLPAA
jgi:PAS domain S-box-containing protein